MQRQQEGCGLQAKDRASGETKPAGTLILDSQLPDQGENKLLLFKLPSLWILLWEP